tara:strand:+ start:186 stop:908 length:723 start_codon:yes stop_codon:yes gene_type:complete
MQRFFFVFNQNNLKILTINRYNYMKVDVYIPHRLSDITLREYKAYDKIMQSNKEDEYAERFINLKMLEIFCGVNYENAKKMPLTKFNSIVQHLYKILSISPELVQIFKMGDTEFGFIPNLEEITFGEYIDLDTYLTDMQNIEKAMAVLYRPVTEKIKDKYQIIDYDAELFSEAMLDMPLDAVIGSIVFFWNLGIDLSKGMMSSLQVTEAQQMQFLDLQTSGVGLHQSINLLKATLEDLKK